jgi:IKI3 family
VVMQMPRGNLETVNPRALVLAAVKRHLDARCYAQAWELVRTNRMDLNILVDYAWPDFLSHTDEFVAAVPDSLEIADLLSSLQPNDVTATGGPYPSTKSPASHPVNAKPMLLDVSMDVRMGGAPWVPVCGCPLCPEPIGLSVCVSVCLFVCLSGLQCWTCQER